MGKTPLIISFAVELLCTSMAIILSEFTGDSTAKCTIFFNYLAVLVTALGDIRVFWREMLQSQLRARRFL